MSQAIARTSNTKFHTIQELLEQNKAKFSAMLPKALTPDRLIRVVLAACSKSPALLQCSTASLLQSVMTAAQLGLEPGSPLGEAYLVPYGDTCTFIPGYRGLLTLARRSGQIISIEARVVHEKDKFICKYGLESVLEHEPDWSPEPGPLVAVYAVAKLRDGGVQAEVMTRAQVDAIRSRSKASKNGPWVTDYDEMARKTVVRRICKYLPLTIELATALEHDDDADAIDVGPSAPAIEPTPKSRTKALTEQLKAQAQPQPEEAVQPESSQELADDLAQQAEEAQTVEVRP